MKYKIKKQDFIIAAKKLIPYLLLALLVNGIIECLSHRSFITPFQNYLVFLYNSLLIFTTLSLILFLRKRIFGGVILGIIWIGLGTVNFVLQTFRVTPFTAVDFKLIKYGFSIAGTYLTGVQMVLIILLILLVFIGVVVLWRKLPGSKERVSYLVGSCYLGGLIATMLLLTGVGINSGLLAKNFGNIASAYHEYGFAYCFSASVVATGIEKPAEYSEETIAAIYNEEIIEEENPFIEVTGQSEDMPNIIFLQLESFFDPTYLKDVAFSADPIPFFRSLKARYSTGYLAVPSIGAGTANTEFEVITGMNLNFFGPGEYPYKTILQKSVCESIAFNLKELGYKTHALHNNEGTFYDRHKVFSQLGFDTFTSIEYMDDTERNPTDWVKDAVLTTEIVKILAATPERDFIYGISVQGHGAYPEEQLLEQPVIRVNGSGVADIARKNQMEYYVNQLYEMDLFLAELVDTLEAQEEDYVLVLYGDHLPTLNITDEELENGNIFETEYVIVTNLNVPRTNRDLQAYQLTAEVLDKLQLHTGTMIRYHQKFLLEGGKEETYLENMKILEYDMLYGDYEIYGGTLPYEATALQMGVVPIVIQNITISKEHLLIFGEGFNQYSKVYLNGKFVDAILHSSGLLEITALPETDELNVSVKQVGNDKIVLSETADYFFSFSEE